MSLASRAGKVCGSAVERPARIGFSFPARAAIVPSVGAKPDAVRATKVPRRSAESGLRATRPASSSRSIAGAVVALLALATIRGNLPPLKR